MGEKKLEKTCSVFSVSLCSASAKNFNFGASLFQNSTDLTLESVQEDVGTFPCPTKSLKESTIPKFAYKRMKPNQVYIKVVMILPPTQVQHPRWFVPRRLRNPSG